MKYFLRQRIIGNAEKLPLEPHEFLEIKKAHFGLSSAFSLEEAYDLLVSNYIELEQEVVSAAAREGIRREHGYDDFFGLRSVLNRRFVNLLSTCRSYMDQVPQILNNCTADSESAKKEMKRCFSKNYDGSFSYRLLEAMRNHVQHCGLAVHEVSIRVRSVSADDSHINEVSIEPYACRKYFELDNKFKNTVLAEMPEKISLLKSLREYMQSIGEAHGVARILVDEQVKYYRNLVEIKILQYREINNGEITGLAAIEADDSELNYINSYPLILDWDDVRLKLSNRNSLLRGLASRVVVSRGA